MARIDQIRVTLYHFTISTQHSQNLVSFEIHLRQTNDHHLIMPYIPPTSFITSETISVEISEIDFSEITEKKAIRFHRNKILILRLFMILLETPLSN